ncbi:TolC family protein [Dyadobacter sp. LHD-138]|uniref:TolC family protein n=1 Tax=Dyadobacter sp. LHD-138 TaxID=3071413 RepID=UPI0027E03248|nr:TolC family protein [Dyadobacter sp. LHD-138]MDQ6479276.1 TolC family protein [Dyadobacter sp. LHD-138]
MKKRFLGKLVMLLAFPLLSQAQTAWSLKDCIDYGLKHFGTVRIAQYQKENARQQSRQALAGYLPQVSGTGTFDDNLKLQMTTLPAGILGPEPARIAFGTKYQTNFTASADQVIFDKSLLTGIKANKPNQQRAELNERQTQEEIIYQVSKNYYQVFVSQQQISLLQDNLERTQQVLNILKLQRDNGVIQPVDYDRTDVSYNSNKSQLSLAKTNVTLALNRLKYQMGLDQDQELLLKDSLLLTQLPKVEESLFDAKRLTDFQLTENELTLNRLDQERIKAGYLPRLSFNARYGQLALTNELGNALQNFRGFATIGLKLNIPIFDGFNRSAQIQQARIKIVTQEEQQKMNVQSYRLAFNNSQSQIQQSTVNVDNDDRNVKLAQKVYDMTTLQYKQGTAPLTDLINAENAYRQAQTDYVNSLINFYQAKLDLEQAQGTLIPFFQQL